MQKSKKNLTVENAKWKNPILYLIVTGIIYIIVQIFTLGTRSLDGDEGVILNVIQADGWNQFWQRMASDVHPPLYHVLTKVSVSVFGIHEWSLRLPSAAAGGLLIILGYWLGLKLWSDKQKQWKALVLGIFFGFAPYLFYYHGEARFYSWLLLGAVLTYGALYDLLHLKKQNIKTWIIFLLGALILVWSQHLGWFILAAEFLAVIINRHWKVALWGMVIFVVLILSYIPFMPVAYEQFIGRISEQGGWLITQNIKGLVNALYRFGADRLVLGISPSELSGGGWLKILPFIISAVVPLVIFCFGLLEIRKRKIDKGWRIFVWTLIVSSIIMALLISEVGGRSVRYLIYLWPFFGIILIDGIWRLRRNYFGKILIALLVLIWIAGLYRHIVRENKAVGEREVANYIIGNARTSDAIVVRGALAGGEKAAAQLYMPQYKNIYDYYGDYRPGMLTHEREAINQVVEKLANKLKVVWFYDFTYGTLNIEPAGNFISQRYIGQDKEQKDIIIYRIERQ